MPPVLPALHGKKPQKTEQTARKKRQNFTKNAKRKFAHAG